MKISRNSAMLADYCWCLQRNEFNISCKRHPNSWSFEKQKKKILQIIIKV